MAAAQDNTAQSTPESGVDLPIPILSSTDSGTNDNPGAPVDTHSTRLMLTTAAHFVQQHLHSELAEVGLTPLDLSVLSGLAERPGAGVPEIATQCLLSGSSVERSLSELAQLGYVEAEDGGYTISADGSRVLADARALEDELFAEKSITLRMELSSLINRLRDGGALDPK
jgi:DNA-binding MarR family transcriptional regulator